MDPFLPIIENDSNADFTAVTTASKCAVFANRMWQVLSSFAGLSTECVSVDPILLRNR